MSSYQNVFGGNTIDPANLGYVAYTITADLNLVWPFEAVADSDVAPAKISVSATSGLSVIFPPANKASVGQDILVFNTGSNTITIENNAGVTIGSVASGEEWIFTLTTNATAAGTWIAAQLGTGTSSATAASLAGAGLRANVTVLEQNLPTTEVAANRSITTADRAIVLANTGGAFTWTFDAVTTLGNGFFLYLKNSGSGVITLATTGGDNIDVASLYPDEGGIFFSDGVDTIRVIGYTSIFPTTVTFASVDLSTQGGTGNFTMSAQDITAQVQDFIGTITGDRSVLYGAVTGYWLVYNNTSGAYYTTFKTTAGDTGVVVRQGNYAIIRSNGTNMAFATIPPGTETFSATGTFTWPVCKGAMVTIVAPGGGGGRSAAGSENGSGGGGGARMDIFIGTPPAVGSTTTVTIGAAGAGSTTTNTAGSAGGDVSFGSYGTVNGGRAGGATGTATGATAGGSWTSTTYTVAVNTRGIGGAGAAANSASVNALAGEYGGGGGIGSGAGTGGASSFGGGGGGGGGVSAAGNGSVGGAGKGGGIAGGTAGTAGGGGTGAAGGAGVASGDGFGGSGGGGGGGGNTGGVGGVGGLPGGGGGGGGFGTTTSGNGGNGGAGYCRVTWW